MKTGSIISYILAAIAIILSFLFILGSFGDTGQAWWLIVGIIGLLIGFALIFAGVRLAAKAKAAGDTVYNVTLDLPGSIQMDTMKCLSCGAPLSSKDITMVNGAPVVTCPNCGTTYNLTEDPKW